MIPEAASRAKHPQNASVRCGSESSEAALSNGWWVSRLRAMSALGTKRTFCSPTSMSAFDP